MINTNKVPPSTDEPPVVDLPAGVEPFVDRKIVPFEIEGSTPDELYASIASKGPRKGLVTFWAYTDWTVDWHYRFKESAGSCAIDLESLGVRATIAQYLPLWKGFANAPGPLKSNFEVFRTALNAHEDQHAQHGIDAAREILAALRGLPAAGTCPAIEAEADRLGAMLHKKNRERDANYDARTRNGLEGLPKL